MTDHGGIDRGGIDRGGIDHRGIDRDSSSARVLHVLAADEVGPCTMRAIVANATPADAVFVFGPSTALTQLRTHALARSIPCDHLASIGGSWRLALWIATRSMRQRFLRAERVIAYGARAECLTRAAGCERCEHAALPAMNSMDFNASDVNKSDTVAIRADQRNRLRRELGIAQHEFAILIAGEPVARMDTRFIVRSAAMAYVGGAPIRLIASPAIPAVFEVSRRFQRTTDCHPMLLDSRAEEPWRLFPAIDAVISDCDGGVNSPVQCMGGQQEHALDARYGLSSLTNTMSALPALLALDAGLPVFAHESLDLGERAHSPRLQRFGSDIAVLARAMMESSGARHLQRVMAAR